MFATALTPPEFVFDPLPHTENSADNYHRQEALFKFMIRHQTPLIVKRAVEHAE